MAAGLGDYKDRNEKMHVQFTAQGYAMWVFDVHGHGESEPHAAGKRAAVLQFTHLVRTLQLQQTHYHI